MHQIQDFEDQAIGAGLLSMNNGMFSDSAQVSRLAYFAAITPIR
jgi:hypothetical protein